MREITIIVQCPSAIWSILLVSLISLSIGYKMPTLRCIKWVIARFTDFSPFFHFLFRRVIILIFALFASFSLQLTMSVVDSVPMEDGFVMPAEWAEHKQTWMGFPYVFLFPPISGSVLIAILLRSVPTTGDPRPSPPSWTLPISPTLLPVSSLWPSVPARRSTSSLAPSWTRTSALSRCLRTILGSEIPVFAVAVLLLCCSPHFCDEQGGRRPWNGLEVQRLGRRRGRLLHRLWGWQQDSLQDLQHRALGPLHHGHDSRGRLHFRRWRGHPADHWRVPLESQP